MIKDLTFFEKYQLSTEERFTLRYTSLRSFDHRTFLLKSAIGTGKTELLKEMCLSKKRVLIVVHRQALARSVSERLSHNGWNIPCYSDLTDDELLNVDRVVICVNSLYKVVGQFGLQPYDLVAF